MFYSMVLSKQRAPDWPLVGRIHSCPFVGLWIWKTRAAILISIFGISGIRTQNKYKMKSSPGVKKLLIETLPGGVKQVVFKKNQPGFRDWSNIFTKVWILLKSHFQVNVCRISSWWNNWIKSFWKKIDFNLKQNQNYVLFGVRVSQDEALQYEHFRRQFVIFSSWGIRNVQTKVIPRCRKNS